MGKLMQWSCWQQVALVLSKKVDYLKKLSSGKKCATWPTTASDVVGHASTVRVRTPPGNPWILEIFSQGLEFLEKQVFFPSDLEKSLNFLGICYQSNEYLLFLFVIFWNISLFFPAFPRLFQLYFTMERNSCPWKLVKVCACILFNELFELLLQS